MLIVYVANHCGKSTVERGHASVICYTNKRDSMADETVLECRKQE